MKKKYYGGIDGLRALSAIGIVMMHIKANNDYEISGFLYEHIIPSFTNLVYLFMMVSAFGMCCGYYDKILDNTISVPDFYHKRFNRIFPFFGVLVLLDIVISPSVDALFEGFADLTLMFGFLPNAGNISVIGVGWFLGIIFIFYLCFFFFCYLLENKRKAWFAFGISILYHYICAYYFKVGRTNILYCACFFLSGGLIYLYRKNILKIRKWILLIMIPIAIISYYVVDGSTIMCLVVSAVLLIYAIRVSGGCLENRITKFISGISMEIYLSHMVMFRIIEKLRLNIAFGTDWVQYIITVVITVTVTVIFATLMQKIIMRVQNRIVRFTRKRIMDYEDINDK